MNRKSKTKASFSHDTSRLSLPVPPAPSIEDTSNGKDRYNPNMYIVNRRGAHNKKYYIGLLRVAGKKSLKKLVSAWEFHAPTIMVS